MGKVSWKIFVFSLLVLFGCGRIASDTSILGGMEYFPHAQGNVLNYKNTIIYVTATSEVLASSKEVVVAFSGTRAVGTFETQILNFSGRTDLSEIMTFWPICFPTVQTASSFEVYYYFTASEVLQIRATSSGEVYGIVYALPTFPIVKGSWEAYGWRPEDPHELLCTAEVIGKETVLVAAGAFTDCIKISYDDVFFVWLAPNVGMVKTTFTIPADADGGYSTVSTTELVSKNF
jgi:hypothetical protein